LLFLSIRKFAGFLADAICGFGAVARFWIGGCDLGLWFLVRTLSIFRRVIAGILFILLLRQGLFARICRFLRGFCLPHLLKILNYYFLS
jgi:hypothetical protein